MKGILLSEYERMFKRKKTIISLMFYFFLILFECFFLFMMDGLSFYNAQHSVQLNSINTAPFFLRELGLFINFILIPMFVVDSFNGEYTSGALRLVLIRPQKRFNIFLMKWIVQASLFLVIIILTWVIATIFGFSFMPHTSETTFYQTNSMTTIHGLLYTIKFYGIAYCIILAIIGISCFMSIIMTNSILAFIGTVAILIGGVYISDQLSYFLTVSDSIFAALGNADSYGFYLSLFLLLIISHIMSIGLWNKKQWMG